MKKGLMLCCLSLGFVEPFVYSWRRLICILYHYYDKSIGPFVNLSDLPIDEAIAILRNTIVYPITSATVQYYCFFEGRFYND